MNLRDVPVESRDVPLGLIDEPDLPSRSEMDEQKLDELSTNIRTNGVLQPLIVYRTGERFRVVAGHRRWHAARRAGLAVVPTRVYADQGGALIAAQYAENRFREELNPADEALLFEQLLERDCGGDVDRLCEQLSEKRGYVEGRLLLIRGDEDVFAAVQQNKIGVGVAKELNRCKEGRYRRYLLHQAIVGGATETVVRGWVQEWQRGQMAIGDQPAAPAPTPSSAAVPETDYFRCYCCGRTDHVETMRPINVHQHCQLAILDPLLAQARGE